MYLHATAYEHQMGNMKSYLQVREGMNEQPEVPDLDGGLDTGSYCLTLCALLVL